MLRSVRAWIERLPIEDPVQREQAVTVQVLCLVAIAWVAAVLYGSESGFAGGEMGEIERGVVDAEHLRPMDFVVPDIPRISSRGTLREILAPIRALRTQVAEDVLLMDLELTRGAYATCLLREYMKNG